MGERACRFCGCVEMRACITNDEPCSWIADDVCSNPVCDAALNDDLVGRIAGELPAAGLSNEDRKTYAEEIVKLTARVVGGHVALEEMEAEHEAFVNSVDGEDDEDDDEEPQAVCADHE